MSTITRRQARSTVSDSTYLATAISAGGAALALAPTKQAREGRD